MNVLHFMRIHRVPGISRTVITTTLDDYSGEHTSSDLKIKEQPTDIKFLHDGTPLLHYSYPICPRCMSRDVSRNGRYLREIEKHRVMIQRYTCNNCSYSFEARPPGYRYGKHIPDHVREKTTKSRVLSSLRKTKKMCNIFLNMHISHETVRNSIPHIPVEGHRMDSSGYFSYDEQYVSINGMRRYRYLLKDQITGNFHEDILPDLGYDTTTKFILESLQHFQIQEGSWITITTDGGPYGNSLRNVSQKIAMKVKRQRCLFHIMKDLTGKVYRAGKIKELRNAIDLINYMFFQRPENMEKLGNNMKHVMNAVTGMSEKDATFRILELITDLYSDDPIIRKFLKFLERERKEVFLYLKDEMVEKTNNVSEHHFSMRSDLLKRRFKTEEGLLKTSYWYHHLSTDI